MVRAWTVLLALGFLMSGCVSPETGGESSGGDAMGTQWPVAHSGDAMITIPPSLETLKVDVIDTGLDSGEPTVGVTSDGTIFVTSGGAGIARSRDHGETWEPLEPPLGPKVSLDPWIWVDKETDRVYNGPLYVVCTWLAWSDDLGETWDANPAAGCGLPAHDHQKITSGPPAEGTAMLGHPNVIYYSYNSFREEGTWISVSTDGGRSFSPGSVAHPSDCHGGVAGPVAVGPEGTAYSPKAACDGANVAVSRDSGATWEVTAEINDHGVLQELAVNPDIAIDSEGNAYLVYPGEDGVLYMATSTDRGASWSAPVRASPPGITFTQFSVVAAGTPGRVSIGYLGTSDDLALWENPNPSEARPEAVWHAYMGVTEAALAAEPVFVTHRLTTDEDPAQRGCIWLRGGGEACRNMLDFIDMVQWEGRPYLVYSDGCDACADADSSRDNRVTLGVVGQGPSLLDGVPLGPLADS